MIPTWVIMMVTPSEVSAAWNPAMLAAGIVIIDSSDQFVGIPDMPLVVPGANRNVPAINPHPGPLSALAVRP